jgi:hypothetical protein
LVKRKSVLSGTLAGLIALFFLSPLDDILFFSFASMFLLPFSLSFAESVIIGCVVGGCFFGFTELMMGD